MDSLPTDLLIDTMMMDGKRLGRPPTFMGKRPCRLFTRG